MYQKLEEERKAATENRKKAQLRKLKKDLDSSVLEDEEGPSCFALSGRMDAGQGVALRLDDEDDTSSDEEESALVAAGKDKGRVRLKLSLNWLI